MLQSMTGFGEARRQNDLLAVTIEVRTVNGRHLKLNVRASDAYHCLEPRIDSVVRDEVRRGTVHVQIRVDRTRSADRYRIDPDVLSGYRSQLEALCQTWHTPDPVRIDSLLLLPGVVQEVERDSQGALEDWPLIEEALRAALEGLNQMRRKEGEALAADLRDNSKTIQEHLDVIEQRSPQVATDYRKRLAERVNRALGELNVNVEPADLVREVSLYCERGDISEEIVRLRSHLEQMNQTAGQEESSGRRLDFLSQEMGREANTIASKSNDVEISRHVVEIKAAIERIREQVQNVE